MKKSDCAGLQHSGTIGEPTAETNSKLVTDGGFPRTQFFGVLGGLTLLSGVSRSEATENFEPEIERAHGAISASRGSVTTPTSVAEMLAIPDGGEVRIKRYRAEDNDEQSVQMGITTGSSESRLSLERTFLSKDVQSLARRLNSAVDVTAVVIGSRR